MAAESTVRVVFLGDAKQLRSALRDVDSDTDKLEKTAKKTEAGFGNLKTALIGLGIGAGLKAVIGEASDLNETVSKTRTIFGDASDEIIEFGDSAATSIGLSRVEALNAVSTFGNLFDQLGVGSDVAARMSTEMVTLAADFASFHNADTVEVTEAMTSAFRGEYDALQRFVPTINAAAVEQEALSMTGKKVTTELTAQEKALAVNSLMMKNAGDAAGDFERTSDSLANQQRILGAEFKNMQAELGQRLMPIASKVVGVVTDMVKAFAEMPVPLQNAVLGIAGAAGAFVIVGKSVDSLVKAKDAIVPAFEKIRGVLMTTGEDGSKSMKNLSTAAVGVGVGLVAVTAFVGAYAKAKQDAKNRTLEFTDALTKDSGELGENTEALIRNKVAQSDLNDNLVTAGIRYDDFTAALKDNRGAGAEVILQLVERGNLNGKEMIDLANLIKAYQSGTEELKQNAAAGIEVAEATAKTSEADEKATASTKELEKAKQKADEELKKLVDTLYMYDSAIKDADGAINDLMGSTHSIADADAAWNESLRDLTESVKENGTQVDVWTEKGNKNREAINDVIEAGGKWLAQIYETDGASARFQTAQSGIRDSLIQTMTELGFSKEEIARYTEEWNKVPSYIETNVAIKYRISTIKELMDEMDKTGFLASGGVVNTPFQIVGEDGPELVELPMGSRVFSNPETRQMMSGAGGGRSVGGQTIVNNFHIYRPVNTATAPQIASTFSRELAVALRGSVN